MIPSIPLDEDETVGGGGGSWSKSGSKIIAMGLRKSVMMIVYAYRSILEGKSHFSNYTNS